VTLLFLESVGTTELLLILIVALIVVGPRKLPELGRSLGRSLGEFKRASDDLKRTWETEAAAVQTPGGIYSERADFPAEPPPPTPVELTQGEAVEAPAELMIEGASVTA
jgi:sec-independent protein translocase protein TatB